MRARTTQDSKKLCSLHFLFYGGFHLLIALIQIYFCLRVLSDSCEMSCWLWSSLIIRWPWLMIHVGGSAARLAIAWPTWSTITPWALLPALLHKPSFVHLVRDGWWGCGSAGLNIHIFSLWFSEAVRPWGEGRWANKAAVLSWINEHTTSVGLGFSTEGIEGKKKGEWSEKVWRLNSTYYSSFSFASQCFQYRRANIWLIFPLSPHSSLTSGTVSVCLCLHLCLNAVILTLIKTTATKGL